MYVWKISSENTFGEREKAMWKSKKREKLSPSMAMIMGIAVTVEIMIAGGMILNIDFRSVDVIALILAFVVLYFAVVAILTDQ